MSKFDWLVAFFIVGGGIFSLLGINNDVPVLITLGFICTGAGCFVGSFSAVFFNRVGVWNLRWGREGTIQGIYSGFWGVIFFLTGAGLLALAVERILGKQRVLVDLAWQHPGIIILVPGLALMGIGLSRVSNPFERDISLGDFVTLLFYRLRGLIYLLLGLAMVVLGIYEILLPNAFDEFVRSTLGPFTPPRLMR